jgi:cytochrome c-type biogenesis protein CcmH
MTLWIALALMTAAAMFAVAWPLSRSGRKLRSGSDLAVYRDQLDEIQRDHAAGLIGDREAEAAKVEVSRRLLAAADTPDDAASAVPAATAMVRRRAAAVTALVVLSFGAASLYLAVGSPSLPGEPIASRQKEQSFEGLMAQVEGHLASNPDDGRGWEVIAPIYLRIGRYEDAVAARRKALALNGETAERFAGLGEALATAAGGQVTPEAKQAFERAVALDADSIKGRYFLGVAAEQDGRPQDAATIWRAMLTGAPGDAPWTGFVRSELARVQDSRQDSGEGGGPGSGPSEDQMAAASELTVEQRTAMVRGMVDRLAERLTNDGNDLEGWLRLVRSYMVIGEPDKARAAVGDARKALGGEPDKLRRIDELVKGLGLEG